jgi:hypothetical protein
MNWDRVLAIVGVVIGIPGFLIFFLSDKLAHAVVVLVVVCACAAWWIYTIWRDRRPVFTVFLLEKTLEIKDPLDAFVTRRQKVRINHKGITEWWCRNLATDGTIQNILIDGMPPDETVESSGSLHVCRRFDPKNRGDFWESTLTYQVLDSFLKNREEYIHFTGFETKNLKVEVRLCRPCTAAELYLTYAGEQRESLSAPVISPDKRVITYELKRPLLGAQYHLRWFW